MDTLPLPPSPRIEQYRKRAKALVSAAESNDPSAVHEWAHGWIESLARTIRPDMPPFVRDSIDRACGRIEARIRDRRSGSASKPFVLADAQHLIAEAHGFATWAAFAAHVEDAEETKTRRDDF